MLKRFNDATNYFENDPSPMAKKEVHLDLFRDILHQLNYLLEQIEVYSEQEVIEGFK